MQVTVRNCGGTRIEGAKVGANWDFISNWLGTVKKKKKNYIYTRAKLVYTSGHCPVYNTLPKQEKGSQSWEKKSLSKWIGD